MTNNKTLEEIEVKIRIPQESLDSLREKLLANGFRNTSQRSLELNTLFDFADRRLFSSGSAVRLRSYENQEILTWKGPLKPDPDLKIREEIETEVSSREAAVYSSLNASIGLILTAVCAGIIPIKVPNTISVNAAIIITGISTVGFNNTDSSPFPKKVSTNINITPPEIIPKAPAMLVKNTDSKIICLFISQGLAPKALLIPISLVRSLTVINNIFPIAKTPAIKVAIPTNQVRNCIPNKNSVIFANIFPKFIPPNALLSFGCTLCKFFKINFASFYI